MRIALDLDGVIADCGDLESPLVQARMTAPGFFLGLPAVEGAIEGVRALQGRHEVLVCSSAMFVPHAFAEKFSWLRRNLPFVDPAQLIFCGAKHVIAADVLVDDSEHHVQAFAGRGILFHAAIGARDPHVERARDWRELLAMLGC